jgi:hypothetical protein
MYECVANSLAVIFELKGDLQNQWPVHKQPQLSMDTCAYSEITPYMPKKSHWFINYPQIPKQPTYPKTTHTYINMLTFRDRGLAINLDELIKTLDFRKKGAYPEIGVPISKYRETSQNPDSHPETTDSSRYNSVIPNISPFSQHVGFP